jgi:hypothetical protein
MVFCQYDEFQDGFRVGQYNNQWHEDSRTAKPRLETGSSLYSMVFNAACQKINVLLYCG